MTSYHGAIESAGSDLFRRAPELRAGTSMVLIGAATLVFSACVAEQADRSGQSEHASWRIDPEPVVEVGEMDGPSDYLFDGVRSVHFLSDDRFVVADIGSSSLRIYDFRGRFLSEIQKSGEGPGEFQYISGAWFSPPDTVHVVDFHSRRVVTFLLDGTHLRTTPIGSGFGPVDNFVGAFSDGSFVAGGGTFGAKDADVVPDLLFFGHYAADGRFLGQIAGVEGRWRYVAPAPVDRPPSPVTLSGIHPLSPNPQPAVYGDAMYYLDQVEPEVVVRTKDGEIIGSISLPRSGSSVAQARTELGRALEERGDEERLSTLEGAPEVDSIPQVFGLVIDDEGLIWTKKYDPRTDNRFTYSFRWRRGSGGDWWVVDRNGDVLQTVTVPDGFMPMQIRDSLMIGVAVDELDVERVLVYRILNRS